MEKLKTYPVKLEDYLETAKDIKGFLDGCYEDSIKHNDPQVFLGAIEVAFKAKENIIKTKNLKLAI